jgi:hypothetical protein
MPIPVHRASPYSSRVSGRATNTPLNIFFRFDEIEAMLSYIRSILRLIPLKSHCNSKCSYIPNPRFL